MARRKKSVIHQGEKGLANHGHGYYIVYPNITVQNIQVEKVLLFFFYLHRKVRKVFHFVKGSSRYIDNIDRATPTPELVNLDYHTYLVLNLQFQFIFFFVFCFFFLPNYHIIRTEYIR